MMRRGKRERVQDKDFEKAVACLKEGLPVVFPTDTVYGIGVSVRDASSPQAIYAIKKREAGKPVAWLVGGPEALDEFGEDVPDQAKELARAHWPGALTVIVAASAAVPDAFRAPNGTIGLRMPDSKTALALIEAVGSPLATSSANLSGGPDPRALSEVSDDLLGAVAAVVEDGEPRSGVASTVIDCSQGCVRLVRQGGVILD